VTGAQLIAVGLIGCGDVAPRYVDAIGRSVQRMRLEAVWDVDSAAGARFARRFGTEFVPSLDDLLALPLDLVCVCTPNDTHASLAERCIQGGVDALVEHPLATRLGEAGRLCAFAAMEGRNLFVMRQRRFLRSVQILRRCIAQGALGRVRKVEGIVCWNRTHEYFAARPWRTRPENRGVVLNQASHFLDILRYLFGEATEVSGVIGNIRGELPVEDTFMGTLLFPGNVEVGFACTTAAPEGQNWARLIVSGSRERIVLGGRAWETLEDPAGSGWLQDGASAVAEPFTGDHAGYLERVRRWLTGERVELVTGAEDLHTLRLIESIYHASALDGVGLGTRFRRLFR
jgi:UDP-N-acetyl-2-amino-2-deoxyglucuronate dehydrogenase